MPLYSTTGFVLKTSELNEQDKLVYLYTNDKGTIKGIAPGALKSKNRFGSKLELFTKIRLFYYHKETKELITISKTDLIKSYFNCISKEPNIFYFYLISELILKYLPQNQTDKRIFRLMESLFESLEKGIVSSLISLYFVIWIQRIEGKMFNPNICYNCKTYIKENSWLSANFEGILCKKCKTDEKIEINKNELEFIKWTKNNPPQYLNELKHKFNQNNLLSKLLNKIEYDAEINLKTKYLILK